MAAALAVHGLLLLAVVQITPTIRQHFVTPAVPVILASRPRLQPPPPPPPKPEPETKAPAPKGPPRASPPPPPAAAAPPRPHLVAAPDARPVPPRAPVQAAGPNLSDSEIAGAVTAASGDGSGEGGGGSGGHAQGCDMIRRLQRVLRADHQVQAAVAHAQPPGSRPLVVWRGDWIQSSGEEGKGLAGLRQAISMEVAFAPEACRAEPVRGVVLLSLSDGPGAARIALGSGTWRWSDLLFAQGVRRR